MVFAIVFVSASSVSATEFSGYPGRSSRIPTAPRRNVTPQSPSPTLLSQFVSSASLRSRATETPARMPSSIVPFPVSVCGLANVLSAPPGTGSSSFPFGDGGRCPPPRGQPGAFVSASSLSSTRSPAPAPASSFRRERERPDMSIEVTSGPETTRSTCTPSSPSVLSAARVKIDTSRGVALPRLLTRSATRSPWPRDMNPRPSDPSRMTLTIRLTRLSASEAWIVSTPGSPWIPSPSSSSPSLIRPRSSSLPGMWQTELETPRLATASTAAWASRFTSARLAPASAAPPATLWTRAVPAMPLLPVIPFEEGSAQSSATTTISTGMPSAMACSAASLKLIRSPV
mmetsp:Transcript_1521/g.3452  ORF Transcript_1521/g.3452 Transcript_1521/m.3452 type:complete len:343 (+) Transcript_1521:760-1788(+)